MTKPATFSSPEVCPVQAGSGVTRPGAALRGGGLHCGAPGSTRQQVRATLLLYNDLHHLLI